MRQAGQAGDERSLVVRWLGGVGSAGGVGQDARATSLPLLVLGGGLSGCQVPRVAAAGLGLTGWWPVHLIAFFSYWTEGLALAVAFAVLGLTFRSRARGRGTACPPGYGLAALAGLALCVPPWTVALLAAGPFVVFGPGLLVAGLWQRNAVLTWWAVLCGAAGVTCGLVRAYASLAGWLYDTIVLILGLATVAAGLAARGAESRAAGQPGSVLPDRRTPPAGQGRAARPGRGWRLAACIAVVLAYSAVLDVQVRPIFPDQPLVRAMRPAIIAYLQSSAYRNQAHWQGWPGAYASGKLRFLCDVAIVEIRPQGPQWQAGMEVGCGDYPRHSCVPRDGGDMGLEVLTLSGGPGHYRVVTAASEPGGGDSGNPAWPVWVDQRFSAFAAFEIKFENNVLGGPATAWPHSYGTRCRRSAAGRTQAGLR